MILTPSKWTKFYRRGLIAGLTFATTLFLLNFINHSSLYPNTKPLAYTLMIIFILLVFRIALSFWTAFFGFLTLLIGGDPQSRSLRRNEASLQIKTISTRTVLIMPICEENVTLIFARLRAMYQSLCKTGLAEAFEIFILSDTRDHLLRLEEEQAWFAICNEFNLHKRCFYRHRPQNIGRKSGNIAEFCQRFGGRYDWMILLDADSLMSGDTLVTLVHLMEEHPKIAILQVPPIAINQKSLFGRILQFTNRLYGQIYTAGAAFWLLSENTYWGHNAIVRIQAFAQHADLPILPGIKPIGGEILSHDVVEAALLREAGWEIWVAEGLSGSYEELPTNMIDYAKRDRRWCQGNLQHLWFLIAKKMSFLSRLQFFLGTMGYIASPLWLVFILITGVITYRKLDGPLNYMDGSTPQGSSLLLLFLLILGMLFLPKILTVLRAIFKPTLVKQFGGYPSFLLSVILELVFSILFAPILMLYHSQFILAIICKQDIGWPTQQRMERGLSLKHAIEAYGVHTLIGLLALAFILYYIPDSLIWFSPVLLGLLCSIPFSMLLSSIKIGLWAKRLNLFCTPEEVDPVEVIQNFTNSSR